MSRIPLARLARIVGDTDMQAHLSTPWHVPELGRNVATNGRLMLAWDDDYHFPPRDERQPDVTPILERGDGYEAHDADRAVLAKWAQVDAYCDECEGPAVLWCLQCCAEVHARQRPGMLHGVSIDRNLLASGLGAAPYDGDVSIYAKPAPPGDRAEAVHIVAPSWTLVVMPMVLHSHDDLPVFGGAS